MVAATELGQINLPCWPAGVWLTERFKFYIWAIIFVQSLAVPVIMIKETSTLEKLAAYNYWANDRLLKHLETLPEVPATALQLFSHVINAQVIWLSRLENIPVLLPLFETHTVPQCRELHQTTSEQLQEYASLHQPELEVEVIYHTSTGEEFATAVQDILLQVFNHGTYHRAQVARDLRQHNLEPVNTDYITYVRRK